MQASNTLVTPSDLVLTAFNSSLGNNIPAGRLSIINFSGKSSEVLPQLLRVLWRRPTHVHYLRFMWRDERHLSIEERLEAGQLCCSHTNFLHNTSIRRSLGALIYFRVKFLKHSRLLAHIASLSPPHRFAYTFRFSPKSSLPLDRRQVLLAQKYAAHNSAMSSLHQKFACLLAMIHRLGMVASYALAIHLIIWTTFSETTLLRSWPPNSISLNGSSSKVFTNQPWFLAPRAHIMPKAHSIWGKIPWCSLWV